MDGHLVCSDIHLGLCLLWCGTGALHAIDCLQPSMVLQLQAAQFTTEYIARKLIASENGLVVREESHLPIQPSSLCVYY